VRPGQGELTYPQRGLTQRLDDGAGWPAGYGRVEHWVAVGTGAETYEQLAREILRWGIQRGAGLTVGLPSGSDPGGAASAAEAVQTGTRVVCGFGVGPLRLPVPCQVVWVEEPAPVVVGPDGGTEPQRAGFGYGTLPGHPASGEEAFLARLGADGTVHFGLLAFSKPSGFIYRLGQPVTRLTQRLVTRRYLRAARALAALPFR